MTITEKIIARHCDRDRVVPGESVWVEVDILMTHDVCGPPTIDIFKREFGEDAKVWDAEKLVILPDHYIFTQNHHANRNVRLLRAFAEEHHLPHYYDVGSPRYKGVCHMALAEEGFNRPGSLLIGTDSHTCTSGAFGMFSTGVGNTDAALIMGTGKIWLRVPETMRFIFEGVLPPYLMAKDLILAVIGDIGCDGATYRAMEFDGESVYSLSMQERMTLTNMAIEAGGKNGIIAPDEITTEYVRARTDHDFVCLYGDETARYRSEYRYDVSTLEPVVAKPHRPDNRASVVEVEGTRLDRAYIGSCTGGKFEDFEAAAQIIKGQEVVIDTYIVPATTEISESLQANTIDGTTLWDVFENAGCKMGQASCGACLGGPSDTFGRMQGDEVVISTTNRNFPGRMGSKQASVYLASPLTVAASALSGVITDPREVLV
ncbi:MAG: 3-isopropylmalate dehydratase large subunit [Bacteroidetes bacterium]|nr:3-isopropylmalate dehydratase large subunit [Bacteroidota bacterium]MCY4204395.1 3-isopropylmalate dehydratase large subunit [Bacteroidota bacterium]